MEDDWGEFVEDVCGGYFLDFFLFYPTAYKYLNCTVAETRLFWCREGASSSGKTSNHISGEHRGETIVRRGS